MATTIGGTKTTSWGTRTPKVVLVVALVIGGACGLFAWTSSMGRASVLKIAHEEGYCASETDCDAGVAFLYKVAVDEYGISGPLLDWCIGVDSWATTHVLRGRWLKDIAVWFMYLPCGAMATKDA